MKTLWYKTWCKILGSLFLIRIGVVLQESLFSKYYVEYFDEEEKA